MPKRPWCCPEPRCSPIFQLKDSDYPDITVAVPGESFFCFGIMSQPVAFNYDGVQHDNDLNSCSYTALKGVIRFQENEADWEALEIAYKRARQKVRDVRSVVSAYRDAEGWVLFNVLGDPVERPKSWPAEIDVSFLEARGVKVSA